MWQRGAKNVNNFCAGAERSLWGWKEKARQFLFFGRMDRENFLGKANKIFERAPWKELKAKI